MEKENGSILSHEVIAQLRLCGHFLHHRMGERSRRKWILAMIAERGEILQKDLQELLEVKSGSLSEMIISLEADGLVKKVKSEKDGRNLVLKPTEKGLQQAKIYREDHDRQIQKMTACFSEEQLFELSDLLQKLLNHWRDTESGLFCPFRKHNFPPKPPFPPPPPEENSPERKKETD